jgi:hypothetical protein
MALPMLADFAVRLAGGLAGLLLITPWRVVPPAFFRTHCLVALGLLVLAAAFAGGDRLALGATVAAAALAYVASIGWGLGVRRIGAPATAGVLLLAAFVLVASAAGGTPAGWAAAAGRKLSSAFLLGSTMSAMLLGHHYLTAPAMSTDPLLRFIRCLAIALALRAALDLPASLAIAASPTRDGGFDRFVLAIRWGMGLLGPAVAWWMARETARIRSTQSATGILYIAMTLVLFGELSSIILGRDTAGAF